MISHYDQPSIPKPSHHVLRRRRTPGEPEGPRENLPRANPKGKTVKTAIPPTPNLLRLKTTPILCFVGVTGSFNLTMLRLDIPPKQIKIERRQQYGAWSTQKTINVRTNRRHPPEHSA
jgi:hypothetical protein